MNATAPFVAGKISELADMAAKWQAGYPLTKAEFEEVCRQREEELAALKEYIDKTVQIIAKLAKMQKQAFVEMVSAKNALEAAKAALHSAKTEAEVNAAQAAVAKAEAAYNDAKSRYLKVEEERKKKEAFKAELDKEYAQWKDALDAFRRKGEERLRELERSGQTFQKQTNDVTLLIKDGLVRGA